MSVVSVNFLAVLVGAIVNMVVGYVWYGSLFGKKWMKLVGITEAKMEEGKKQMPKLYGLAFLAALVMAYVLSVFVGYAQAQTATDGALVGFWSWLGFIATTQLSMTLFVGKPMNLYYLDAGYYLVVLVLVGALLASWK